MSEETNPPAPDGATSPMATNRSLRGIKARLLDRYAGSLPPRKLPDFDIDRGDDATTLVVTLHGPMPGATPDSDEEPKS